jgi:hypothetical protein
MKIKTKLNAGVGLLFLMIMLLAVLGGWYINKLKRDTNNILVANYNTLEYSRNMLLALENAPTDTQSFLILEASYQTAKQRYRGWRKRNDRQYISSFRNVENKSFRFYNSV